MDPAEPKAPPPCALSVRPRLSGVATPRVHTWLPLDRGEQLGDVTSGEGIRRGGASTHIEIYNSMEL